MLCWREVVLAALLEVLFTCSITQCVCQQLLGTCPLCMYAMARQRREGSHSPALIMDWKLLVEHPGALAALVALQQNSHHYKCAKRVWHPE